MIGDVQLEIHRRLLADAKTSGYYDDPAALSAYSEGAEHALEYATWAADRVLIDKAKATALAEVITYVRDHGTDDLIHWLHRRRDAHQAGART